MSYSPLPMTSGATMSEHRKRPAANGAPSNTTMIDSSQYATESRQVAWWPVHEFVAALVSQANNLPIAGTPAWQALADGDPRKLLAVAVAGEHHVLRMEAAQEAMADASREIAGAEDWATVARRMQSRAAFRARNPWAKRVTQ
jgi:hypothetical protein